jgi:putative transposase
VSTRRTQAETESLVVQMACENRDWGYTRIVGALSNLGHNLGRGTVANILKRHGITSTGAQPQDQLEGVPGATLGPDRGG